ncbi:LacI family DNA-binding transcriptional regulator [Croceibacterium sp. LX-88]|uniref:LacI family DNA-binding transcriptional regulator n=1 Tax=Croceibacterium selenioxidans TaxID=2838833 RepID=A0ABS5W5U2_9SPHN|nr:LacI family DNA-binding transcriptional regulator [Croceibacterium selenioxidans]MBT2134457.1 LacI family DNA-binding transcriptional regulator [Croceibacterium selenioxidans]
MATQKRRPTIIDIAKKADVSFKTVSRVLNDHPRVAADLRERVLKAMAELNYQPSLAARSLAGRRGYSIALLVDQSEFFREDDANAYFAPYLVDLQAGALTACREFGYHFFVEPYDFRSTAFPGELRAQLSKVALDGVVLAPPSSDRLALLDALEDLGLPYVRIAPGTEVGRAPSVSTHEYEGTVEMAEHLVSLGHRRIGMICGPETHIAAGVRLVAFREALQGKAELILHPGDFTFAGGLAAGRELLGGPDRPTAIFAANDFMAAGAIVAATSLGLQVPRDVSVTGFDDSAVANFIWPPLTTVRQPIRAMARAAIEYLVALASGRDGPEPRAELSLRLIVRESSAPPGAAAGQS